LKVYLFVFLLGALGCHKEKKDTIKKADTSKTSATQLFTKTGTTPRENIAEELPASKNGTIFWVSSIKGSLVSLACFDADTKTFLDGDGCAAWVPKGSNLRDDQSALFSLSPTQQNCSTGKNFAGSEGSYAFWPAEAKATLITPGKLDPKKISTAEKKALEKEVKVKTKEKYTLTFLASLDVNNDQKAERFYGVTAKKAETTDDETGAPFAFSGLFFAEGTQPSKLLLLSSSTTEQATLLGGVDLDQDGALELWLERNLSEENILVSRRYSLERLIENALEEIAARDVCL
jgi:hypothetical protein